MDGFSFSWQSLSDNYGFAIISIVLIVRFILLPFMLIQVKNMHMMRENKSRPTRIGCYKR